MNRKLKKRVLKYSELLFLVVDHNNRKNYNDIATLRITIDNYLLRCPIPTKSSKPAITEITREVKC